MYKLDKKKFGAFVAQLRKEKGYTQRELAQRLIISDKAVSKWETGITIPDTALLIPLADILGVTVTELLRAQRIQQHQPFAAEEVEGIVKNAISYAEQNQRRGYQEKSHWGILYGIALFAELICLFFSYHWGVFTENMLTASMLAAIFGAYFCFFVRLRLPDYYDENRINGVRDGMFQMHMPRLVFNNRNWPYIVRVGRIWSVSNMALYPALTLIFARFLPEFWHNAELYLMLIFFLGGLFIPLYIVGKKHA